MIDEASLRRCTRCGERKSPSAFALRRRKTEQLDTYCRACRAAYGREHYAANRQRYIDQTAARKSALADERVRYLLSFFEDHPCVDCGQADPVVLEFDHLGDKLFNIGSDLIRRPWQAILDEIAKCDVVCANCHRRRTARRRGTRRMRFVDEGAGDGNRTRAFSLEG